MHTTSPRLTVFLSAAILAVSALFIAPLFASANDGAKKSDHRSVGSTLEVRITDDNSVLVRGAKVTAVSGSTITAETAFGSSVLSWSVRTDTLTKFIYRGGALAPLGAIAVGDYVSFQGTLNTSVSGLAVDAKYVKDWSKANAADTRSFKGTIQSIDVPNLAFTLATGGSEGSVTVKLAANSVITAGEGALAFGRLAVGDTAKVHGTYDSATKTFIASKISVSRKDADGRQTFRGMLKSWGERFQLHFSFRK